MPDFFPMLQVAADQAVRTDFLALFARMGPVAYAALAVLLLFSVISWAVILEKWRIIGRARQQNADFLKVFRASGKFSDVLEAGKRLRHSPLSSLFMAGYSELRYQLHIAQVAQMESAMNRPGSASAHGRVRLHNLESIHRALQRATAMEVNKMERSLNFLATTAGAAPFIGLFGTVWGVMTAFQDIGARGSTSLATVAPGIAEALILTAAGLFAAIPALIGYNFLLNKIKVAAAEMDDFSMEFVSVTERSFIDSVPLREQGTSAGDIGR